MSNEPVLNDHDLPTWMRQARQTTDWGVVIVFFFSLLIAMPFLAQGDIPRTTDLENHAYMASSYAEALREGRLYPRWVAGAISGYGAPIGNYYPPATPYLLAVMELFFTNDTIVAMRLVAVMAIVLCGMMTYLFILRQMRAEYALISALLYVCSPILGLTVPYVLGDLPLLIASALLPMSLWSLGRIIACKNPLDGVFLAVICAMMWLTHIEMAFVTHALLLIFILMQAIWGSVRWKQVFLLLLSLLAGVGLSAFFWLPAWVEQTLVTWITAPYHRLLPTISIPNLLMPLALSDFSRQVQAPQIGLGFATLLLGVLSIVGLRFAPQHRRMMSLWGICAFGMVILVITQLPQALWMLVPITFCFAILGSGAYALAIVFSGRLRRMVLPAMMVLICLSALPVWFAPRWDSDEQVADWSDFAQIVHEQLGYGVAVLPPTHPIPITIPTPIVPNRTLISGYQDDNVTRIPQSRLTVAKQAGLIFAESHRDRYFIQTDTPAIFEVLRAFAPGWIAEVDGTHISAVANPANGLLQIVVPRALSGILTISYESTPIRIWAWWVSAGVAILLVFMGLFGVLRSHHDPILIELRLLPVASARLVGIIAIGFGLFFALFLMPQAPYPIYPQAGHSLNEFVAQNMRTDVGIEMLGYYVPEGGTTYAIGDVLQVQVAWRTARRLTDNYQVVVFLQAVDAVGLRWLQTSPRYLAGYPTRRWSLEKHLVDEYSIPLTDVLAKGDYQLVIEVYRCPTTCLPQNRINFFDRTGDFVGSQVALFPIFKVE